MASKRKRSSEPDPVRKAWQGMVEITSRDHIRAQPPENLHRKVHKISVQPVQSVDASPPPGQTFILMERRPQRLNLLQQLQEENISEAGGCGSEKKQAQMIEKLLKRLDELETKQETQENEISNLKARDETKDAQIHELQFYADLFTTREQVAYSLLQENFKIPLDKLLSSAIRRIANTKPTKKQKESFYDKMNMEDYKGLLDTDSYCSGNGLDYLAVLVAVEQDFVQTQKLEKEFQKIMAPTSRQIDLAEKTGEQTDAAKAVLDTTDLRDAMRKVCRGLRTKRNSGAHAFEQIGLDTEERRLVLKDLKAAIAGGPDNFRGSELKDHRVLKLLKICCKIEEQRLGD